MKQSTITLGYDLPEVERGLRRFQEVPKFISKWGVQYPIRHIAVAETRKLTKGP